MRRLLPALLLALSPALASAQTLTAALPESLAVGATVRVKVAARDALGRPAPGARVILACNDTAIVWPSLDRLTGRRPGTTLCRAAWDRVDGSRREIIAAVTVPGPTDPDPGPPPVAAPRLAVAVAVTRWDGATAGPLVTGVPLPPGAATPGDEARVHLHLRGEPQRIAVTALPALHPDGSLRSVLVACVCPVDVGELTLTDTERDTAHTLHDPPAPAGVPAAALLPTDPAYLVSTLLVGPTRTVAESRALGGVWVRYEDDLAKHGAERWVKDGDDRGDNYYDRALVFYALWARSGAAEWWDRANRMAHRYRVDYLEANNYASSPHYAQLEGVQLHYLATGDTLSRVAVSRTAELLHRSVHRRDGFGDTLTQRGENRQLARALQAEILAHRLAAPYGRLASPDSAARAMVDAVLRMQSPDGAWRFKDLCGGGLNYMDGMLAEQLIEFDRLLGPDPRILPALERHAEWAWATQWRPADQTFNYATLTCSGVGGPTAARDVLGLQVNEFAWLYAQTGDAQWRARAEAILGGMVGRVWLDGTKQFNQQYALSYRTLAYLTARP